jgi:hypothetical protein
MRICTESYYIGLLAFVGHYIFHGIILGDII